MARLKLTKANYEKFCAIFEMIDRDNSNTIDTREFLFFLRANGLVN